MKAKVSACHIAFLTIFNKFACFWSLHFLKASEHSFHRWLGNVLSAADVISFLVLLEALESVTEALATLLTIWINSGLKKGLIVRRRNDKNITSVVRACLR